MFFEKLFMFSEQCAKSAFCTEIHRDMAIYSFRRQHQEGEQRKECGQIVSFFFDHTFFILPNKILPLPPQKN